jgi:Flp pilus assembly protein TadG
MRRVALRAEHGQALAYTVVFLTVFVGMAALAVDAGSWLREQRQLQTAADAAALAGAQELPAEGAAQASAADYAGRNERPNATSSVSTKWSYNDTIDVVVTSKAPGFFSKLFNILEVDVGAKAQARVAPPSELKNVAPIAVKNTQEKLACSPTPCFREPTRINFEESTLTSSTFGLVDLSKSGDPAGVGSSQIASWIEDGYPGYLGVDQWYDALTGQRIGPLRDTLREQYGKTLLFPVFDAADPDTRRFHVVGWAAFVITNVVEWRPDNKECRPNCKLLEGYFVDYIATGFFSGPGTPNFGVRVVALTG